MAACIITARSLHIHTGIIITILIALILTLPILKRLFIPGQEPLTSVFMIRISRSQAVIPEASKAMVPQRSREISEPAPVTVTITVTREGMQVSF